MAIIIENKPQPDCHHGQPQGQGKLEYLCLDWDGRRKPRQRLLTDQGTEIVLALPRGTVLRDRECLYQSPELTIEIKASEQNVLKIEPANAVETCRVAHHLGNWHRSIEVKEDGSLLTEGDQPFIEWLQREGIKYEEIHAVYHPNLSGAEH